MEKITAKTRPVFMLFLLDLFFFYMSAVSFFWHVVIERLPMNSVGYEKASLFAVFSAILIFFMIKFPFLLKFGGEKTNKKINLWRAAEYFLFFIIFALLGPSFMQLILGEIHLLIISEILAILGSIAAVFIIEKILIPAAKISQKN
jgi:hypothetical protein